MNAFQLAATTPWAIERSALSTILRIAARAHDPEQWQPLALEARQGEPVEGTSYLTVRDNVAVLSVRGPLFRRANLFTRISGATSIDILSHEFTRALEDPAVQAILFDLSSPGGEVSGIQEFADRVFAARAVKPMATYVTDMAASGGYWIAVAPGQITLSDTGMVGSIGAVIGWLDDRRALEKAGLEEIEFVSSVSPNKRPDPKTDSGAAQFQSIVDALGTVFVERVAKMRGVTVDAVLAKYGQGGMTVGQAAVDAGVVDRIGTFEATLDELSARGRAHFNPTGRIIMVADKNAVPRAADDDEKEEEKESNSKSKARKAQDEEKEKDEDASAKATAKERRRVLGILSVFAVTVPAKAQALIDDPNCTAEQVDTLVSVKQVIGDQIGASAHIAAIKDDEDKSEKPSASGGGNEGGDAVTRIVANARAAGVVSRSKKEVAA